MGDSFKTTDLVILQPNDLSVPYTFEFTVCSSATANDGALPYGDSAASVAVTAHNKAGADKTSEIISGTPSLADNVVTVVLNYPSTSGTGTYHLTFVVTTSSGAKVEFDFNRISARDV